MPVTLVETIFQGPVVRCVLRDAAETEIVAHIDEDERPAGLQRGQRLWAAWEPNASRLLPPRAAEPRARGIRRTSDPLSD